MKPIQIHDVTDLNEFMWDLLSKLLQFDTKNLNQFIGILKSEPNIEFHGQIDNNNDDEGDRDYCISIFD